MIGGETLEHCEGYNVLYPGGHLGFVELVLHNESGDVTGVGVACGLFATRVVIVPIDEIAHVDPASQRVTLFDTPEPAPYEYFAEVLHSHVHARTD